MPRGLRPVDERSEAAAVDVGWESLGERTP
jgi:hypothetical protein